MYSHSADQAMVQQQERYLIEFLPRELRYAYDVELFASLEEVPVLEDSQTILYSDTRGVWQKRLDQMPGWYWLQSRLPVT